MDDAYESVLYLARECFVYKVPPRSSAAGYKAAEWGDMEAFLWKGRVRIIEVANKCEIRLEDSSTGELFAMCPYALDGTSVEPVLDSSRYFVLRVESSDPTGATRKAYIGMGFQDRSESFDFNVALQDWTKRTRSAKLAAENPTAAAAAAEAESSPHLPAGGSKKDYSLKEGETFSIKIPGGGSGRKLPKTNTSGLGASTGGVAFLPPPPSKR